MTTRGDASVISTVASRDSLEIIVDAEKQSLKSNDDNITNSAQTAPHAARTRRGPTQRAGLGQMAMHMVASQDRSGVLFRRFDKANVTLLLGMEREVADLEEQLEVEKRKRAIDGEAVGSLTGRLRTSMREYYETMLLTKEIMALSPPTVSAFNATRRAFPSGHGQSEFILEKYHTELSFTDLCSIAPCPDNDLLTRILNKFSDGKSGAHLVTLLSALCAVFFLVGGMVGLYFVQNMRARLGLVGMFTVLFAAMIAGATGARRQEVFVATAAYAAVLVVFVSGNIAADPEPIHCVLVNANSNAANAGPDTLGTGSPPVGTAGAMTVTAIETSTLTFSETGTMRTVLSIVTSTLSSTPTVIMKKGEMSGLAKTGIGVGTAVAALFVLMLVGNFLIWVRKQTLLGSDGVLASFTRAKARHDTDTWTGGRRDVKAHRTGVSKDVRSGSRGKAGRNTSKSKERRKVVVETKERDTHVVWV